MHWLLLLALLSSTTGMKNGGSTASLNRLAETSLRRQLGRVNGINVRVVPGRGRGDFQSFDVSLDGFSADRLMNLEERATISDDSDGNNNFPDSSGDYDARYPDADQLRRRLQTKKLDDNVLGDILGGIGGGKYGDILGNGGKYGGVLGDILGGSKGAGRIGRIRLRASNFSFHGARYNNMNADLGEIRFDWSKALRGEFDIKSIAPGSLSLSLTGEQMAKLIGPRLPSLSNVKVRFSNGRAFVGARSDLYGVRVPFEVGARLSVQQNRVMATDFAASVARLRLPSIVLNELTRGVNPLYDFDPKNRLPLAINLNTAQASGNSLAMRGGIQWVGFNRNRRDSNDNEPPFDNDNGRYPDEEFPQQQEERREPKRNPADILGDIFGR